MLCKIQKALNAYLDSVKTIVQKLIRSILILLCAMYMYSFILVRMKPINTVVYIISIYERY